MLTTRSVDLSARALPTSPSEKRSGPFDLVPDVSSAWIAVVFTRTDRQNSAHDAERVMGRTSGKEASTREDLRRSIVCMVHLDVESNDSFDGIDVNKKIGLTSFRRSIYPTVEPTLVFVEAAGPAMAARNSRISDSVLPI